MKKAQTVGIAVLAVVASVLVVPVALGSMGPGIDAHERVSASKSAGTTTMQDAHQRTGLSSGSMQRDAVDAHERLAPRVETPAPTALGTGDTWFDWGKTAIGASSALLLTLIIGASVFAARRYRGSPLPR